MSGFDEIQWSGELTPRPEWIEWTGGPCPFANPNIEVEVRFRDVWADGARPYRAQAAALCWQHRSYAPGWDIVAYREIWTRPPPPPPPQNDTPVKIGGGAPVMLAFVVTAGLAITAAVFMAVLDR